MPKLPQYIHAFWCLLFLFAQPSSVQAADDDVKKLSSIQANCVKYFQDTPHGKCTWVYKVFKNGDSLTPFWQNQYAVAYNGNHVFWDEQPKPKYSEAYILTDKERLYWFRSGLDGGAVTSRRMSCFNGGDPMLGCVIHPRYVGTFLEGIVSGVIEKPPSPRGIFSDGTLERVGLEEDELDGEPVWKGIYKWGFWDLEMYYTKSEPTLLKRSFLSVLTNNGLSTHQVDIDYRVWGGGIHYPVLIEHRRGEKRKGDVHKQHLSATLDVLDFRPLNTSELKSQFQLAALNPPEQVVVNVLREDCNKSDHFHYVQGELVPFTDEELEELKNEQRRFNAANSPVSDPTSAPSVMQTSFQWGLWFMMGLMILGCVVVAMKVLKKNH